MVTAEIIQLQEKPEAKFICSACGEDRSCNCNAPAVEKLAEMRERHRVVDRESKRRKRQQKQQSVYIDTDGSGDDEDCPDCATPEEASRMGFLNAARTAAGYAYYHDLADMDIDLKMVTAAQDAASAWTKRAAELKGKCHG